MRQIDILASSQNIVFSPVLQQPPEVKRRYFCYLNKMIRLAKWNRRKYTKAQLVYYKSILCTDAESICRDTTLSMPEKLCYLIPFDIVSIAGFQKKVISADKVSMIIQKMTDSFAMSAEQRDFLHEEFSAALGSRKAWDNVMRDRRMREFGGYLSLVRKNIFFIKRWPYSILLTATMSAGKSTLINVLVGKNVSLMQNMACTSKIHFIVSKPFEDGMTSEYDHDIAIDAEQADLLSDNEENLSSKITVGTYFNSSLCGKRLILLDSPGVNSSENAEHCAISNEMIRSGKYKLLIYVMNATQLATHDEFVHLGNVKKSIGQVNIIFVLNKIDELLYEDEKIPEVLNHVEQFLKENGFKNPIICPVSARAAYLAQKSQRETISRLECQQLEDFMDLFEQSNMEDYYKTLPGCLELTNGKNKVDNLLKNCGIAYLEQIIDYFKGRL